MGRIVEVLVGVSALAGVATFLGFREVFRRTVRGLGRHPEDFKYDDQNDDDEYSGGEK